jgi:hypothetical protein
MHSVKCAKYDIAAIKWSRTSLNTLSGAAVEPLNGAFGRLSYDIAGGNTYRAMACPPNADIMTEKPLKKSLRLGGPRRAAGEGPCMTAEPTMYLHASDVCTRCRSVSGTVASDGDSINAYGNICSTAGILGTGCTRYFGYRLYEESWVQAVPGIMGTGCIRNYGYRLYQ